MNITRRMIVIPVATVMAAGIGAGAFTVGLSVAQDAPEAVTADTTFVVSMDGQQEVTAAGVAGVGDPNGRGIAEIRIDTATDQVCVDLETTDVDDLVGFHIHRGVAGVNGPIVVDFGATAAAPISPPQVDNTCVAGGAVADEIAASPLGFYLNAHTNTPVTGVFPAGAVRGQLQPLPLETHLLPTPVRVYDSRLPNSLGTPALESNSTTVVDLTPAVNGTLPPGATGALITVTATDVRAAGFLTVYSNALTVVPATSTLNWNLTDEAVTTTVKVDATGSVKITLGPDGGADVIIDVLGYLSVPATPLPTPV